MLNDCETLHYAGHIYRAECDEIDNSRKLWHSVRRPDGSTITVPFTPYECMSGQSFETFVEMGCPVSTRDLVGTTNAAVNFDNAAMSDIRLLAEDNGLSLSDLDGIKAVRRLRAQ